MKNDLSDNLNLLGQAIYCNCFIDEYNRYKIIGSITSEGIIEILRGHKNMTVLEMHEFVIKCRLCGFSKHIILKNMEINHPVYENN